MQVFQGAAVSSERFSQSPLPRNIAEETEKLAAPLGVSRAAGAAVPCRSYTSGHRICSSKHTRGQSRETDSLSTQFSAWKLLPHLSGWVLHTVEQGYRGTPPPPFNGVITTLVGLEQALVIKQEASTLLRNEAIKVVPPLDKESAFYSHISLFLGRMGGCILF